MKESEILYQRKEPSVFVNGGILDSRAANFLGDLGTQFYFWVDEKIVVKGGYDINEDNGLLVNTVCHAAYGARKAIPFAKELQAMGLFDLKSLSRLALRYFASKRKNHVQSFEDRGTRFYTLNLRLEEPSLLSVAEYLAEAEPKITAMLGNCSKGHIYNEANNSEGIHVCPYRLKPNCFYTKRGQFIPKEGSLFHPCSQSPCLVGYMHSYINERLELDNCSFSTVMLAQQAAREIPRLLWANTEGNSREFLLYGTCAFSLEYLVRLARLFPNFQGTVMIYENGCKTLGDRMIRLGGYRDWHIARFIGGGIEDNPMVHLLSVYKEVLRAGV